MNCKICNTRVPTDERSCPNCGVEAQAEKGYGSTGPTKLPAADLSTAKNMDDDDLVELNDLTDEIPAVEPREKTKPRAKPAASRKAPAARPLMASDAASLRRLLAQDPTALEPDLEVYCDDEGTPLGAGYTSGVGEIDLLATNAAGELVVVLISREQEGEELVAEVLQRIGWVRKHVSGGKRRVRGIVLCEQVPESLSYSATAVADTVQFKTYRVALSFEDLEF
jgi:hypothetical protein